tara:strand:- start:1585 stop:2094 length:510 start_codon:yes stop_codon:yes gene_type:complete
MEQTGDKLTVCKCCGSDACYESEFTTQEGPINTWLCMTCGFTSNSTMTEDSEALKQIEELTAELIRDLKQVHDGLAFFPTAITMPDSGMIFPEPMKGEDDWGWTVVKAIEIPKEDQNKFPDPRNPGTFYKKKMDMKNMKRYDKLAFMDAAEELGMFAKPVTPVYNVDED